MILLHPRIYTLDPARVGPGDPWGQVGALQIGGDGEVAAAGSRAEVLARRRAGEEVVEVEAACVLPGLIDTHAHLTSLGVRPGAIELPDSAGPAAWAAAVAARAAALPAGAWITGRGWNQAVWEGDGEPLVEGFPTHAALTAAAPRNPVYLQRADHHAAWVNRAALEAAGLMASAPAVEGGRVIVGADGRPSGVLIDEAMGLVERALPPLEARDHRALLRERAAAFLARGVTCVHCALVPLERLEHYEAELGGGAAGLRVRAMLYARPAELAWEALRRAPSLDPAGWLHVATLKAFADGALGSRGAWMLAPYEGAQGVGGPVASPEESEALARAALARGWQLATHAIGDRALRETLAAWRRAGLTPQAARALGWRVEHVQHATPEDLNEMRDLGLMAAMQPIHCTRDMRFAEALLGPARCAWAYAWRAVLERQIPLGFGSDYPIETLDPWQGLQAALTRQDEAGHPAGGWFPAQRLTLGEALAAYTTGGAALAPADRGRLGHLGQVADLVALDQDPTEAPPERLGQTRALATMTAGRVVHGALR
jgi:predicted amidohydrolase YtcJ